MSNYGNTPFKLYEPSFTSSWPRYVKDSTNQIVEDKILTGFSPIMKCPKYLGIKLNGQSSDDETRIYLYIGDLINNNFKIDKNYIFCQTSSNVINYLNPLHNRFIETDGTKYFYYKIVKGEATVIGANIFPQSSVDSLSYTPYCINNSNKISSTEQYSSIIIPNGCYFAVMVKPKSNSYKNLSKFNYSYDRENSSPYVCAGLSFGNIPKASGAGLIKIPDCCSLDDLNIYVEKATTSVSNKTKQEIGRKLIKDFSFTAKKNILWDGRDKKFITDKKYYGIPYSSRWQNSHFVGFEISPETAANALNDQYSVAYDGGAKTRVDNTVTEFFPAVSGKTEISTDGGTGYGLVCSAFCCLTMGNPYPQTNRGFTFDNNFIINKINNNDLVAGKTVINKRFTHVVNIDDTFVNGYSLQQATKPCIAKTMHTNGLNNPNYLSSTMPSLEDNYIYQVENLDKTGYQTNHLLNFNNIQITNGNVKPWKGHKAVLGPWDKKYGIGITLQNSPKIVRLQMPSGLYIYLNQTENISKNYIDITKYINEEGIYTLDTGDNTIKEQFKYYNNEKIKINFSADGCVNFLNEKNEILDNVEYAYVKVKGYGSKYSSYFTDEQEASEGPMVLAKGKCYPDLAKNPSLITKLYAAIVSDPDKNNYWGKYSCCFVDYKNINNSILINSIENEEKNINNLVNATNKSNTKLYLLGAETQNNNTNSFSNINIYIGEDNRLYINDSPVITYAELENILKSRI